MDTREQKTSNYFWLQTYYGPTAISKVLLETIYQYMKELFDPFTLRKKLNTASQKTEELAGAAESLKNNSPLGKLNDH